MILKLVAELVRESRKNGVTLQEISNETGISLSVLSRIRTGDRVPTGEHCDLLADYFGYELKKDGGKTSVRD